MPASLHILAGRVVKRAIKAGAVIDPVKHFGDISELDRLAREISCPPIGEHVDLLDAPVVIDDISLRRLSWAAKEWVATSAFDWWENDKVLLDLAYAWAMAHARDKSALQRVRTSEREARAEVLRWARATSANYDAIMAACRYLSPKMTHNPGSTKQTSETGVVDHDQYIGTALLTLVTETERSLDYWIFEAPAELTEAALSRIRENFIRDRNRMIRALGKEVPPDPHSWHMRASARFNKAAKAFMDKFAPKPSTAGEAGIGPVEPSVGSSVVVDERSRVDRSTGVQDECDEQVGENPSHERTDEEENPSVRAQVHELGPSGEQQGRDPIVG
mgnify:CR=1 FL=1